MKKVIGLIGCGAIGTALAEHVDKKLQSKIDRIIVYDTDLVKSKTLAGKILNITISNGIEETVDKSDLVIEAASGHIIPDLIKIAIDKGKDVLVMSIGGLLGNEGLIETARQKGIKLILPSGAIGGIDVLKSAKIAGIEEVTLTTHKAPGSIKGAPYLLEKNIDVEKINEETVVFEGNALEAIKGFPKNVNVSALLSIAGIGAQKTKVRIVVSPEHTRNIHEIKIKSIAGTVTMRTENVPFPANPKTSYLAALAAIASLEAYFDPIRIGT